MAATSGSVLALAARLRALPDDELTRLVTARGVRAGGIDDFFDLAEALLDRTSVQAALERLDRPTLAVLAAAGELAESTGAPTADRVAERVGLDVDDVAARLEVAISAGLAGAESGRYAPWDAVVEQLRSWPAFGLPTASQLADIPAPAALERVSAADARFIDRGAGDRAFATVAAITDLLLALRDGPARRLTRGGVALPDARRLGEASGVEPEEVGILLDIAGRAGLVSLDGSGWEPLSAAGDWLAAPRVDRWRDLAAGWLARLPEELRDLLRDRARAVWGEGLLDYLRWLYPGGGEWIRSRAATFGEEADLLGLAGSSTPSTPGTALLLDGPDAAAAAMAELLPPEVDSVYLQDDLTIISPGPLRADLDLRMRGLADVETRGVATGFRITAASLTRSLLAGESEAGIREFLSGVSVTGFPQPLDYLVAETAARFGSLRVGAEPGGGSYVRSDDPTLLRQVAVDQTLATLGLADEGDRLVSRFDAGVVVTTLVERRYPAVREDAAGRIAAAGATRADRGGVPDDTAAILIAHVREVATAEPDDDRAWLVRQIELAAKGKVAVTVTVRMPDGSEAEYTLEPAAVAGGRLRARDRRADIERTLPLSSIVDVRPA